jgi:hypothetical protein
MLKILLLPLTLLVFLITPPTTVLLEKLIVAQLVKNFLALHTPP